jgi:hypothetical protein
VTDKGSKKRRAVYFTVDKRSKQQLLDWLLIRKYL